MNTKLLKQKILDLAIRGKLTQQLKSDGTAADLLKQISEQKRESSSTLSSPRRRGSPSAQSEKTIIPLDKSEAPFEVPANWEWVRLGDVVLNRDAERKPVSKKDRNLHAQKIYDYYGAAGAIDKVEEYLFDEKLLLIGEDGANLLSRSKPNAFLANGKYWVNNHAHVIDAIDKSMLDYLAFYINAISLDDFVTGTAQPKLNQENLNKIPIPLPPLAEQQRIVAKIEEAFAEIDAIEKNKELLKTHIKQTRQKILDLAIHGKLVPQNKSDEPASVLLERITRDNPHYEKMGLDERRETKDERDSNYKRHSREGGNLPPMLSKDEVPFEVPENWCWCRLGDICNKLIDGDHNPPKGLDYVTKYMMLSSRNINDNDIVDLENVRYLSKEMFEEENQRTKLEEGDILFTSVGSLGRSCIFSGDGKYCFQRSVSLIHTNIYNKYLKYFFDSNFYQKYIVENATGTAQMGFYLEQMRKSFIAIPPLAEQSRIVAKIEELFAELDLVLQNV